MLHGPQDLRIELRDVDPPSSGDVQVSIHATGLCGSDLHYFNHGRVGEFVMQEPMALGHESAGIISAVGTDVSDLSVGDKVALEVGQPCEACARCQEGRYNLCKDMRFRASAKSKPVYHGTLQDRVNAPAKWCHKLPEEMPLEVGALVEPLSVAMHALRRAQLSTSSTVLIFGAGTVGLLTAVMAKVYYARRVIVADIDAGRLAFAKQHGFADITYLVRPEQGSKDRDPLVIARQTAELISELPDETGAAVGEVDAAFECTGVPSCVAAGIYATRPGGKLVLIGIGAPAYLTPMSAAALREVDILGVFRYADTYRHAIKMLSRSPCRIPNLSRLITHRFKFPGEAHKALATAARTEDETGNLVLKVMLKDEDDNEATAENCPFTVLMQAT
ncbi:MAG: hypothetical protein M1828_003960 [Chrysothrix sp. TS-e1954]|nr:MAG: hypothetical protein M1828_003960 [Chrysothrix sp. TS-e1954]